MRGITAAIVLTLVLSSCQTTGPLSASNDSVSSADSQTTVPTDLDQRPETGMFGLFRADPTTLQPESGSPPITAADGVWSAALSQNGNWLALEMVESESTMIIRVVDVRIGMVVSEARDHQDALSLIDFVVGDDGTVYGLGGSGTGLQGLRLELGGSSFEPIVDEFPDGFVPWRGTTLLESERVGWSGVFDAEATQPTYGLVTTDLSDGTVRSYPLDGVTGGLVDEHDLGDFMLEEFVLPGVAWDMERRRALVVHADERVVSVVDLPTGDVTMHRWAPQTSWIERLATWGMSRVLADQPSLETIRQARLSPDGTLLYVGTSTGEFETWEDGSWAVTRRPRGVEVISTESWEQTASWGIPASNLNLSSDGNYLVATGITNTDTGLTGEFGPGGVFVIDTITMDLIGKIGGDRTENPAIEFSEDGSLAYVMSPSGTGEVQMIDLANAEVVQTIQRPPELTVLDQGRLIVTQVP